MFPITAGNPDPRQHGTRGRVGKEQTGKAEDSADPTYSYHTQKEVEGEQAVQLCEVVQPVHTYVHVHTCIQG